MKHCPNCFMPKVDDVHVGVTGAKGWPKFACGSIYNLRMKKLTVETKACEKIAALTAALLAYPEWTDDTDADGCPDGFVTCIACGGGGRFNQDGTPSKRTPPVHRINCLRDIVLAHLPKEHEDANKRTRF
jgi:hypothetical protein